MLVRSFTLLALLALLRQPAVAIMLQSSWRFESEQIIPFQTKLEARRTELHLSPRIPEVGLFKEQQRQCYEWCVVRLII